MQQAELHRTIVKVASAASESVALMQSELQKAASLSDQIIDLCKKAQLVDASNEAKIRESLQTPSGLASVLKEALTSYVDDINKIAAAEKTAAANGSGKAVSRNGFAVDKTASVRNTDRSGDTDYIGKLGRQFR